VGKRLLGRPKPMWEDTVNRDAEELGGGSNCKELAMDRGG